MKFESEYKKKIIQENETENVVRKIGSHFVLASRCYQHPSCPRPGDLGAWLTCCLDQHYVAITQVCDCTNGSHVLWGPY